MAVVRRATRVAATLLALLTCVAFVFSLYFQVIVSHTAGSETRLCGLWSGSLAFVPEHRVPWLGPGFDAEVLAYSSRKDLSGKAIPREGVKWWFQVKRVKGGAVVEVPLWSIALVWTSLALLTRRGRKRAPGECAQCGYDLKGVAGRCPECGSVAGAPP
jgi:hypothetical protein